MSNTTNKRTRFSRKQVGWTLVLVGGILFAAGFNLAFGAGVGLIAGGVYTGIAGAAHMSDN